MSEEFIGLAMVDWQGLNRLFAVVWLDEEYLEKIVDAYDKLSRDRNVTSSVINEDEDYDEQLWPGIFRGRAIVLPDHAWKHLGSSVIEHMMPAGNRQVLVRFSKEQAEILHRLQIPADYVLSVISNDEYEDDLSIEISLSISDDMVCLEEVDMDYVKMLKRKGLGAVEHGEMLHDYVADTPDEDEDEDEDDDADDQDDCCSVCYESSSDLIDDMCPDCREQCSGCGRYYPEDEIVNGLCEDCGYYCEECEERVAHVNENDHCDDCAERFTTCVECDELIRKSEAEDGKCPDCYDQEECADCGGTFDSGELDMNDRCPSCAENYSDCNECGDETHHDNLNIDGICDDCMRNREEANA